VAKEQAPTNVLSVELKSDEQSGYNVVEIEHEVGKSGSTTFAAWITQQTKKDKPEINDSFKLISKEPEAEKEEFSSYADEDLENTEIKYKKGNKQEYRMIAAFISRVKRAMEQQKKAKQKKVNESFSSEDLEGFREEVIKQILAWQRGLGPDIELWKKIVNREGNKEALKGIVKTMVSKSEEPKEEPKEPEAPTETPNVEREIKDNPQPAKKELANNPKATVQDVIDNPQTPPDEQEDIKQAAAKDEVKPEDTPLKDVVPPDIEIKVNSMETLKNALHWTNTLEVNMKNAEKYMQQYLGALRFEQDGTRYIMRRIKFTGRDKETGAFEFEIQPQKEDGGTSGSIKKTQSVLADAIKPATQEEVKKEKKRVNTNELLNKINSTKNMTD
jgi:hypothetical protein